MTLKTERADAKRPSRKTDKTTSKTSKRKGSE